MMKYYFFFFFFLAKLVVSWCFLTHMWISLVIRLLLKLFTYMLAISFSLFLESFSFYFVFLGLKQLFSYQEFGEHECNLIIIFWVSHLICLVRCYLASHFMRILDEGHVWKMLGFFFGCFFFFPRYLVTGIWNISNAFAKSLACLPVFLSFDVMKLFKSLHGRLWHLVQILNLSKLFIYTWISCLF